VRFNQKLQPSIQTGFRMRHRHEGAKLAGNTNCVARDSGSAPRTVPARPTGTSIGGTMPILGIAALIQPRPAKTLKIPSKTEQAGHKVQGAGNLDGA